VAESLTRPPDPPAPPARRPPEALAGEDPSFVARLIGPRELPAVLEAFTSTPSIASCLTHHEVVPAQAARTAPFPDWLDPAIVRMLRARGVDALYSHQRDALDLVRAGRDIAVVTPTASGKSLCYHLPVLHRMLERPGTRALYLFPTKALAQDQYHEVHRLVEGTGADIGTFTYDGDTPNDARIAIRDHGHIVISNPDMLHTAILPHHTKWAKLFRDLEFVVLDEVHTYRGVFGSHVCNVLRRLQRIAAFHGANPRFICCSATIANPGEHASGLIERPVTVVDKSGAPHGERHVLFYNPPVVNKQLGIRASYLHAARRFAEALIERDVPTIVFALSRLNVEILLRYLRESLKERNIDPERVQGYRGGYLPTHRRAIERGLREGHVTGVVATNALELGIDIGHLSAVIVAGYPGSVASLWQQAGRAGRRSGASLTLFVARSAPLDQYIVENPAYFFEQSPEHARIHPDNLFVAVDHIRCGAFELPFEDGQGFGALPGEEVEAVLQHLAAHRVVNRSGGRTHWMNESYPANAVSLRRVHSENFVVVDMTRDRIIAEVDFESVQTTLHDHAIYNVDGQPHEVVRLDYPNHKAFVRPVEPDYFTDAMTYSKVEVLEVEDTRPAEGAVVEHGAVSVTRKVVGFKKIKLYTHENVGYGEVTLPEVTLHTSAYWLTVPRAVLQELPWPPAELVDALLGVSHALFSIAVITTMSDPRDLGHCVGDKSAQCSINANVNGKAVVEVLEGRAAALPGTDLLNLFDPTLFVYESVPGGVGFSEKLFQRHEAMIAAARDHVARCECEAGCPSCIGPMPNGDASRKQIALALLERLAGAPPVRKA